MINLHANVENSRSQAHQKQGTKYKKSYSKFGAQNLFNQDTFIEVDFESEKITYAPFDSRFGEGEYPSADKESTGFIIHRRTTTNFSSKENFVCLLAVDALLSKGYEARHIILEPTFQVGHNQQVYGDILVLDKTYKPLCLIENKTYGAEFDKEWRKMRENGGQLFSYYAVNKTPHLCLLAYDFEETLQKIIYKSHIITTIDNQKHLDIINADISDKEKQKLGFDDPKNANAKDYFKVWNESYSLSYTTKGLLESSVAAYSVGKEKYTIEDLEVVPYSEIASIYHTFATILRNNAIGNYENTFYILVDLFLCKIIDERQNPQDLQFYYKGVAYDSPFDYIDRLLSLYEKGIDTLFKKKVVNVSKSEIDQLFTQAKRHKGKFKEKIQSIFDKQKYFNIKKFNFIEVENEEEFFINFKVLIQMTNLIQDFYITQSENNQFLGDLFEGFLNRSVHQTEGRFFTPTPITNFIIYSLPHLAGAPKVLDFACGAGHFLTEFVAHNSNAKLYGIEKNKDLSKVAKTACVLHNANEASIIFQDALDSIKERYAQEFENASFDLILSNPPYSVKGFLSTLDKIDNFTLSEAVDAKSYETNGAIECFFIERAKHFLKENGLLVLVLPVSILQKAQIYEKTREILFKHFKILAIAEMNSRTFGSTGTQTVILFAKRVEKYAQDLINALKEANFDDESVSQDFQESHFLRAYCEFMGYGVADFKAFMNGENPAQTLLASEIFKEYQSDFNADKPKVFKKEKNKTAQQNHAKFLEQMREIEFEKMLYFALIKDEKILIIKSPSDKTAQNKTNKANIVKFLGYDWSKRKGDEGIKYQTAQETEEFKESKDDSDEEKKSKEALRNINSIKRIKTPLYNPSDKDDPSKLSTALREFIALQDSPSDLAREKGAEFARLLEHLQPKEADYYSIFVNDLADMLDFSRADFGKAVSLNPPSSGAEKPFENSKFELVKLCEICDLNKFTNQTSAEHIASMNLGFGNVKLLPSSKNYDWRTSEEIAGEFLNEGEVIALGIARYANIKKCKGKFVSSNNKLISVKDEMKGEILFDYVYEILVLFGQQLYKRGSQYPQFDEKLFDKFKIPKAPREIQLKILNECEPIDQKTNQINRAAQSCREFINAILVKCAVANAQEVADFADFFAALETSLATLCHFDGATATEESTNAKSTDFSLLQAQNAENSAKLNALDLSALKTLIRALPTPPPQGWERVKLERLLLKIDTGIAVPKNEFLQSGKYPIISQESDSIINGWTNLQNPIQDLPVVVFGDHSCSFKFVYFPFFRGADGTQILKFSDEIHAKFAFYALQNVEIYNREKYERHFKYLKQAQIPLPKITAQESIIKAVEWLENAIFALNAAADNLAPQKAQILQKYLF